RRSASRIPPSRKPCRRWRRWTAWRRVSRRLSELLGRLPVERPVLERGGLHGLGDEVALRDVAAETPQQVPVRPRLDTLGDRLELQLLRHVQARAEDHLARLLFHRAQDERL